MNNETVIWAIPAGQTDRLYEDIMIAGKGILTQGEIDRVKASAAIARATK